MSKVDQFPTALYLRDTFPDDCSDISETSSYKTVDISEEEQLRRDLLKYPSLDPNDIELKFEKYNYPPSKYIYQDKIIFNEPKKSRKTIIYTIILLLTLVFIIFYFIIIPKLKNHTTQKHEIVIGSHTSEYQQFWKSKGNTNYYFYNNLTFGSQIFKDPCVIVSDLNLVKTIINSEIQCDGEWCKSAQFLCTDTLDCYDLQYIIPLNGPEFKNSCKNITGNLVMSWKRWSQDLDKIIIYNYQNGINELNTILGLDTLIYARSLIETCQINNRC